MELRSEAVNGSPGKQQQQQQNNNSNRKRRRWVERERDER
jgi:hypothetical protein